MTIEIAPKLSIEQVAELSARVVQEVEKAVVGKRDVLHLMMAALLSSGGHILLEDYPGLAKTLMANSFAKALGMAFKRIQFTPDLLPGDITGGYVFDSEQNRFTLRKGPIFANILLADEINRASPKTQSALLEAMQEYQVTLEGEDEILKRRAARQKDIVALQAILSPETFLEMRAAVEGVYVDPDVRRYMVDLA